MFKFSVLIHRERDTGEILLCPECRHYLRLVRLNPGQDHRLKKQDQPNGKVLLVDLTLPSSEWIANKKREICRWFHQAIWQQNNERR